MILKIVLFVIAVVAFAFGTASFANWRDDVVSAVRMGEHELSEREYALLKSDKVKARIDFVTFLVAYIVMSVALFYLFKILI